MSTEKASLARGCFWVVEELIRQYPSVISAIVGYTRGDFANATYTQNGTHAEAIEIMYNPSQLTYRKLLEHLFSKSETLKH